MSGVVHSSIALPDASFTPASSTTATTFSLRPTHFFPLMQSSCADLVALMSPP